MICEGLNLLELGSASMSASLAGMVLAEVDHPLHHKLVMWGPVVGLSRTPGQLRPACLRGEHNRPLLRELGYEGAAIDDLERTGVVSPPDVVDSLSER
jgi:crotonobetainyl-CoA:carnitine CoA-transferase CaiB-like acyl-CoA transferase